MDLIFAGSFMLIAVVMVLIIIIPFYIVNSLYVSALCRAEGDESTFGCWVPYWSQFKFGTVVDKINGGQVFGQIESGLLLLLLTIGSSMPWIGTIVMLGSSILTCWMQYKFVFNKYCGEEASKYFAWWVGLSIFFVPGALVVLMKVRRKILNYAG